MGEIIVFYDMYCVMCRFFKHWFQRLGRRGSDARVQWNHYTEAAACGLNEKACGQALHVQTAKGEVEKGFYAVRYLLAYTKLFWLAPLLYIPGIPWIGVKLYAWVANNRYRLFGEWKEEVSSDENSSSG
ncbi:MAG: thiol-disulfide oxidoreductase DCC family protein [Clostridia bacterium]